MTKRVGVPARQWYRMTTSEVLRVLKTDTQKNNHPATNKPLFLPEKSWRFYTYTTTTNGELKQTSTDQLHIGDSVSLRAGDIVPATMRLLRSQSLAVLEGHIGGQTLAYKQTFASKSLLPVTQQKNMVFAGSEVVTGHATGVIVQLAQDSGVPKVRTLQCRMLEKKGIILQTDTLKTLRNPDCIFFDDLQQPREIHELVRRLYLEKGIAVTFFVQRAVAASLKKVLPDTVFTTHDTPIAGVRSSIQPTEVVKASMLRAARQAGCTSLYVHRGTTRSLLPKIADISMVIAPHAAQSAIRAADVVSDKISVAEFSSILYNKK